MTAVAEPPPLVAAVDLGSPDPEARIGQLLRCAGWLGHPVTLACVISRRQYQNEQWPAWPDYRADAELPVHRTVLGGEPATALSNFADRVRAAGMLVPSDYGTRRWLFWRPLAPRLAALTSRPVWIVPREVPDGPPGARASVACALGGGATDVAACALANSLARRWNASLLLIGLRRRSRTGQDAAARHLEECARTLSLTAACATVERGADEQLITLLRERQAGVLVTVRPMYVSGTPEEGSLIGLSRRLPCPLVSVPLTSTHIPVLR